MASDRDGRDRPGLADALHQAPGIGWFRGIGYHDSAAGSLEREWLDRFRPKRPIRIQHRSGRLWVLNRLALTEIGLDAVHDGRGSQQAVRLWGL